MKNILNRRNFLSSLGLSVAGVATMATPLSASAEVPQGSKDASGIKITGVKTYKIPRGIFVKIETNAGITGWGESSPNVKEVVEAFIHKRFKDALIGKDPFDVEPIWDELFWRSHDLGPSGGLPYALAGIDLALWDIKGKVLNVPVYKLLGGKYRSEMKAYCGIEIGGGSVPVAEAIDRSVAVAKLGFKTVKLRIQIRESNLNPDPDPTIKYYKAIRKELPENVDLFVDPNEGYTAARAITVGKELQAMGMKYFEGPCPRENNRDTRAVVDALDIPVLAGEKCYTRWEIRDLIMEGNPDIIQPDIIKAGGITEVRKMAAIGQAFFKTMVPHNTKPTWGTAAALHVMCSISNAGPFIEFIETQQYADVLSVFENAIDFKDGKLQLPEGPGLGLVINEKKLEKLAAKG